MIFTEDFNISDKYRLSDGEKVATVEMMPARFTILKSFDYGPNIDADTFTAIKNYFDFKQKHTNDPNYGFDNDLYVYHVDGVFQEFFCKKFYTYSSTAANPYTWKLFVEGVGQPKLYQTLNHINRLTSVTDATVTNFNGISIAPGGDLISIRIYDSSYDLDELSDNEFLSRVNEIPAGRPESCKGTIDVYPDKDTITYRLNFKYPKFFDDNYKGKGVLRYSPDTRELADSYLDLLSRDGGVQILTADQVALIQSKLQGQQYFNLEFDVNPEGTVEEVYVYVQRVFEFEDLTTQ